MTLSMEDAERLLRGGDDGVKEWNSRRKAGEQVQSLHGFGLSGVDVGGADLSGVNLTRANLEGSTFSQVLFTGSDLSSPLFVTDASPVRGQAQLGQTRFDRCDFTGADFHATRLQGATFHRCILAWCRFRLAEMEGVNLHKSVVGGTSFSEVDLSTVEGLDSLYHYGASYVDLSTLAKSRGEISADFLRGCGVAESLIDYLPSLVGAAIEFYSCFISYSHADKSFARRLHDALQGQGIRCWLDEHQLKPGQDLYDEIDRGIRLWDKVLLCCSRVSLSSWWVEDEIAKAVDKEQRLRKERGGEKVRCIIPVDLDGFLFDGWKSGKRSSITDRLAANFRGWEADNDLFERELEKLLAALRTDEGREPPPPSRL